MEDTEDMDNIELNHHDSCQGRCFESKVLTTIQCEPLEIEPKLNEFPMSSSDFSLDVRSLAAHISLF